MMAAPASISIVIEWENAERIGSTRAHRMLDELHRQITDPHLELGACELIFVYDGRAEATETRIAAAIRESGRSWPAAIRLSPAPTADYYEQKNHGAALAKGEAVIFLDSDVVPGPRWLANILSALANPKVGVVGGTTSVEVSDFYSAAMAVGWIFPLPAAGGALNPARSFHANNVAFRREVIERHRFPKTGQYRGQCTQLAEELRQHGHGLYVHPSAAVAHPPPEWFLPFALRALWAGHDASIERRLAGKNLLGRGGARLARDLAASIARIWMGRRRVGFGILKAGAATGILLVYHVLRIAAFLSASVAPDGTKRGIGRLTSRSAGPAGTRSPAGRPRTGLAHEP